jgi:chloramphenicol-sensitive protein RarD
MDPMMREETKGVLAMLVACTIWGLSALYYRAIAQVPPLEVLSHRTIWSAVFIGIILIIKGRALTFPRGAVLRIFAASVFISLNWFFFIYAVQVGEVRQSSLGYYIFPLVAVALGALFLGERLKPVQWFAVGLAVVAVLILSVGVGQVPYISLVLAFTFGFYGLVKKGLTIGPMRSVFWEVVVLLPPALIWLFGAHMFDWQGVAGRSGGYFGTDLTVSVLLVLSGLLTGLPLMLMAFAVERLRLATVGLVQYVNPTLQFLLAAVVFMEPVGQTHIIAFALIWGGLAIYSYNALRQEKV